MDIRIYLTVIAGILLFSCVQNNEPIVSVSDHPVHGDIIHLPRRTPIPKQPKRQHLRTLTPNAPDLRLTPYNALGAIHSVGNGFIAHPLNIGNGGVIDVQSILSDNITSSFIFNTEPGITTSTSEIHSDFESIRETVTNTKKITSGFSLNLGLFSIGQKSTYYRTFHSDITSKKHHRWGNINLYYYAKRIGIEKTQAALKSISYRNISDAFLYSIYSFPISNYIKEKGFLVVTDFFVGGRLSALVDYSRASNDHIESDSTFINLKINGAFGWGSDSIGGTPWHPEKAKNNLSASIGYRNQKGNGVTKLQNDETLSARIEVYGGDALGNIPNSVIDLKTSSIHIGDWYKSLSDPKTHKFIDVADGGLVGIDNFMLELNFKYRVSMTLEGRLPYKKSLDIPYVEIRNVSGDLLYLGGIELGGISAAGTILHTRQGDDIILLNKDFQERLNEDSFEEESSLRERYRKDTRNLVSRLSKVFKCEIKSDEHNYNNVLERDEFLNKGLYIRLNFSFDKERVYKYKNARTNIWYIYDPVGKTALSYYDDPNDDDDDTYITDMYGITDWVESVREKKTSMKALATGYKIIGL